MQKNVTKKFAIKLFFETDFYTVATSSFAQDSSNVFLSGWFFIKHRRNETCKVVLYIRVRGIRGGGGGGGGDWVGL